MQRGPPGSVETMEMNMCAPSSQTLNLVQDPSLPLICSRAANEFLTVFVPQFPYLSSVGTQTRGFSGPSPSSAVNTVLTEWNGTSIPIKSNTYESS